MKVAVYCRVSTKDQNPGIQEEIIRSYCDRNNFEIYKVYTDFWTGASDSRPSFNDMIQDMRSFKFSAIIVTKLDRIGRSLQHLLSMFDELNNKKVTFIAVQQNIDTSSSIGKLQMQILGAFAEFERNLISERTKDGIARAVNVGKRGKDKSKRSNAGYKARWSKQKRGG